MTVRREAAPHRVPGVKVKGGVEGVFEGLGFGVRSRLRVQGLKVGVQGLGVGV